MYSNQSIVLLKTARLIECSRSRLFQHIYGRTLIDSAKHNTKVNYHTFYRTVNNGARWNEV